MTSTSHWSRTIWLAASIGLVATMDASAESSKARYRLSPESELWIEVSSNIKRHSCTANVVTGDAHLDPRLIEKEGYFSATADTDGYAAVSIASTGLDCGNGRLNRDMYKALKAGTFPFITYTLEEAESIEREDAPYSSTEVRVHGSLTVAGHKKIVHSTITTTQISDPGMYRVTGSIPVSMREFQIDPPTAFFGLILIRARDHLTIHFDLFATALTESATASEPKTTIRQVR